MERWQGPPNINKVKLREVVLHFKGGFFNRFIQSRQQREFLCAVCWGNEDLAILIKMPSPQLHSAPLIQMTAHIRCLIWWAWRNSLRLRAPTCWQRCPMPRILKEPEGCEFSIFRYTVVPACLDMLMLSSSGVLTWKCLAMVHLILDEKKVEPDSRENTIRVSYLTVTCMLSAASEWSWNR